jgi:hypothetical protein
VFLILVVGGAIINIAVAWGFAIREPFKPTNPPDVSPQAPQVFASHGFQLSADDDFYAAQFTGSGLTFTSAVIESEPSQILILTEAGWLVRSLSGVFKMLSPMGSSPAVSCHHAIELSPRIRARNPLMPQVAFVLPLRPIWPGFAINTVFYAGLLWLLFAAPSALRRRRRIRRGLCPACAYDLRGGGSASQQCPECGKSIEARCVAPLPQ